MAGNATTIKISGGDQMDETLRALRDNAENASVVDVGFLEDAKYPDGTQVASVAFWNEYGTRRAPARPFFRDMIADKSPEWPRAISNLLVQNNYDAEKTLNIVGEAVAGQLAQSIYDFDRVPLAPSTIAAKGFDKQLIDSGQMVNSIRHEVKK